MYTVVYTVYTCTCICFDLLNIDGSLVFISDFGGIFVGFLSIRGRHWIARPFVLMTSHVSNSIFRLGSL